MGNFSQNTHDKFHVWCLMSVSEFDVHFSEIWLCELTCKRTVTLLLDQELNRQTSRPLNNYQSLLFCFFKIPTNYSNILCLVQKWNQNTIRHRFNHRALLTATRVRWLLHEAPRFHILLFLDVSEVEVAFCKVGFVVLYL